MSADSLENRGLALRGFARLTIEERRRISSLGGKAAHEAGTAHTWTQEEAREAGRKGGQAVHKKIAEEKDKA